MEAPVVKHIPRDVDITQTELLVVTTTGLPPFIRDEEAIWCDSIDEAREVMEDHPDGKLWRARLVSTTSISEWETVPLPPHAQPH